MTTEHLRARTKQFALRVLKLVDAIPLRTAGCRAIANQPARSGSAVGANYRAACKARSRAEVVAKIGIVEEEADESAYWMELIIEGGILKASRVTALYNESVELVAIMAASRTTAAKALRQNNRQSAIGNRQ